MPQPSTLGIQPQVENNMRGKRSEIIVELWQPNAAMGSAILTEPMHSFSHGHHHQRNIARGCICMYGDENVTQYGAYTGQPLQCSLQFAAYNMHAIWYWRSIS